VSAKYQEGSVLDDRQRVSPAARVFIPGANEHTGPSPKRWWSGPFIRLLATNAAIGFSISCFYLLPKHLTIAYAASPGQVGAVVGVFGLMCVLVVPWLGRAVNRLGLPRTLVVGQILLGACAFAFASLSGIGAAMMLLRALQGLATAGVMTAGVAMVCELAPAHKLGQAMGLAGAASLIMNAIAPAIAEPIGTHYGYGWVFAMSGATALLGAMVARRLPGSAEIAASSTRLPLPRHAFAVLVALAVTGAGFHVVMAFLAPLALSRGIETVGGFFVAYTVAALAMRTVGSSLSDRLGLARAAVAGIFTYGIFIAAIAAVGAMSLVGLGFGFGLAHGVLFPALMALLFHETPPGDRSRLAAFANGVMNLGMLTVLGFGQLANQAGLVAVFVLTGVLVASLAAALALGALKRPVELASAIETPAEE
jgi:MFS family permease